MDVARYNARRRSNAAAMVLALAATAFGLGWLVLVLGALLWKGFSGLSPTVFTQMTPPPGASGGLLNPIIGSLMMTKPGSRSQMAQSLMLMVVGNYFDWRSVRAPFSLCES